MMKGFGAGFAPLVVESSISPSSAERAEPLDGDFRAGRFEHGGLLACGLRGGSFPLPAPLPPPLPRYMLLCGTSLFFS